MLSLAVAFHVGLFADGSDLLPWWVSGLYALGVFLLLNAGRLRFFPDTNIIDQLNDFPWPTGVSASIIEKSEDSEDQTSLVSFETADRFRELVDCCRGPMKGTVRLLRRACEELRENEGDTDSLLAWLLTRDRGVIWRFEEVSARLNNTIPPPGRDVSREDLQELKSLFVECHRHHYDLAQAHRKVMASLGGPEYFWLDDEYDSLRQAHLRCRDKLYELRSHSELGGLLRAIHEQVEFVWNLFPRRDPSHRQELQALYDEGQRIRDRWPSPDDDFEVEDEFADWAHRVADYLDANIGEGSVEAFAGRFVERKVLTLNESELRERLDDRMRRLGTIIERLSRPSESQA